MTESYSDTILKLTQYFCDVGGPLFPDRYAALRHALFLTNHLKLGDPGSQFSLFEDLRSRDALTRISIQEFAWACALQGGLQPSAAFFERLRHKECAALLRAIVRSQASVDVQLLLDQIGRSNTLDSLVRDALLASRLRGVPDDFGVRLARKFDAHRDPDRSRALITLLDIAATFRVPMLTPSASCALLDTWSTKDRLFSALLRYVGALGFEALLPVLSERLVSAANLSVAQRFALVNALMQLQGRECAPVLERWLVEERRSGATTASNDLLCQYLTAILQDFAGDGAPASSNGLTVAQFMFLGAVDRPGKGNSGGLGVFLMSLGDALGALPDIAHVYTLVLLNATRIKEVRPLILRRASNHTILHVPICNSRELTQYQMMAQESAIRAALAQLLFMYDIEPDIFHIRYSDHSSRAAATVAREMGKKMVFTLTTDPHRRLSAAFPKRFVKGLESKALTFELHRVYLADQLLRMADGVIAMPNSAGLVPLKAYFPQLVLDSEIRAKPLRLIAEGIQLLPDQATPVDGDGKPTLGDLCERESSIENRQSEITDLKGCGGELDFHNRPLMLSVGRLHPIKQQHLLVAAWAESGLWHDYNLVLIGGNLISPNAIERRMLAQLEATFERYPDARAYFCLLPALPNAQIRALEHQAVRTASIQNRQSKIVNRQSTVPVYVCSSVKEEFGIAVLEAMDAGFLVFGPQAGGLSSYISAGENGFLMDTTSAQSMAGALTEVLLGARYTADALHAIAAAGTRTVRERFDIHTTAQEFARFYREVAGG